MNERRIFLPFTTDKTYWDIESEMIFINRVYCEQLEEEELRTTKYKVCEMDYPDFQQERFKSCAKKIAQVLGHEINGYSRVNEKSGYWEKVLFRWLLYLIPDLRVKIFQLETLRQQYPDCKFYTYSKKSFRDMNFCEGKVSYLWKDDYHFWLYTYLALNYYDIDVEFIEHQGSCNAEEGISIEIEKKENFLKKASKQGKIFCERAKRITLEKLKLRWYTKKSSSQVKALYYCIDIPQSAHINWIVKSEGKIQPLNITENIIEREIDPAIRIELISKLNDVVGVSGVIADVLPRIFPKCYLEEYDQHHRESLSFLKKYSSLRVILSETGIMGDSRATICSFLAQARGVKLLGVQHGGNHDVLEGFLYQEGYLNDVFYSWSRGDFRPHSSACEILSAPYYKFRHYQEINSMGKGILFVGTCLLEYPNYNEFGYVDRVRNRYIQRQIDLFDHLSEQVQNKLCIREYYLDSGWHITNKMKKCFPRICFSSSEMAAYFGDVDMDRRNVSFAEALMKCELMICDHLSTTWREAIYLDKPFIMLLDQETTAFTEEAVESMRLLESVGVVFYNLIDVAELVNRIHMNISSWWNEPRRKNVMGEIRRRFLFEVENTDDWWRSELLRQAES